MAKRIAIFFFLLGITGCSATFYKYPSQIRLAVYQQDCLDILDANTVDGAPVQIYACGNQKLSQQWTITPVASTSEVQIMNEESQKCMSVSSDPATGGVNAPGQSVVQELCEPIGTAPSQLWKFIPGTGGAPGEQLVNVASGQCLDLPYGAIASIFLMQQYTCTPGDPAQGWNVHPVQIGTTP